MTEAFLQAINEGLWREVLNTPRVSGLFRSYNYTVCVCVCVCVRARACTLSVTQWCLTLYEPMDRNPAWLLCPWNFSGKNTGAGSHFLLQGIFPTQGSNPGLFSLVSPALAGRFFTTVPPGKPITNSVLL